MVKDGSEYFGPYTSFKTVHTILDLIKELYQLRTCNYDLSKNNIDSGKFKVCLEYHIGNCKGPHFRPNTPPDVPPARTIVTLRCQLRQLLVW